MNAYLIATDAGFRATVFADTESQAVTLFCIHHEVAMDVMPTDFEVGKIGKMWSPLEQEYLEKALATELIGVGYHLPGRGWEIVPPDIVMKLVEDGSAWQEIAALKDRAPTRLYRYFDRRKEIFVFARHMAEASNILTAWRELHAVLWKKAKIDPNWASTRSGVEAEHLTEALSRRLPGIGRYDPAAGWTIDPWPGLRAV